MFKKGDKKPPGSGRVRGVPNKAHRDLKELLDAHVPDDELWKRWQKKLDSKDEHISLKALELVLHYRFGKPVQPIVGDAEQPPIQINVSAIPKFRVRTKK